MAACQNCDEVKSQVENYNLQITIGVEGVVQGGEVPYWTLSLCI